MAAGGKRVADESGATVTAGDGQCIAGAARVTVKVDAGLKPDGLVQAGWL